MYLTQFFSYMNLLKAVAAGNVPVQSRFPLKQARQNPICRHFILQLVVNCEIWIIASANIDLVENTIKFVLTGGKRVKNILTFTDTACVFCHYSELYVFYVQYSVELLSRYAGNFSLLIVIFKKNIPFNIREI